MLPVDVVGVDGTTVFGTGGSVMRAPIVRGEMEIAMRNWPRWGETSEQAAARRTACKPRARQFWSRVLNRYLWRVHSPGAYDGCGVTLDGAYRVYRANNQL
jgi:hypothetical protein